MVHWMRASFGWPDEPLLASLSPHAEDRPFLFRAEPVRRPLLLGMQTPPPFPRLKPGWSVSITQFLGSTLRRLFCRNDDEFLYVDILAFFPFRSAFVAHALILVTHKALPRRRPSWVDLLAEHSLSLNEQ